MSLRDMVPAPARRTARNALWGLKDVVDSWRGAKLPPRRLLAMTSSRTRDEFTANGDAFLDHFIELGHLETSDRVLEVGSGVGWLTIPLTRYLSIDAHYEGFDLWADGTSWCQRNITPKFPNFTFRSDDVRNAQFNPAGRIETESYRLPYEDGSFDFALLCTISHLPCVDLLHYVGEIGRLLRPGGTYFGTWFLFNDDTVGAVPEKSRKTACSEDAVRQAMTAAGLEVTAVHRGGWAGTPNALNRQDIVVGRAVD